MNDPALLSLVVFGFLAVGIILSVFWFIQKARQQKAEEQRAMNQFRMDMEREFISGKRVEQPQKDDPSLESRFPTFQESTPPPQAVAAPPVREMMATLPVESDVTKPATKPAPLTELVIMWLKEANLFESSDGPYFPLDPSGECVLIKLKRKKTALLVPRFESQHFIQNALKRFDYVFLVLSKDEVIVLNSFSGFVAGHFKLS
ncbi:type II secretion system protein [Candidatus Sumerlaeota bacterium]|nr:type II secretion system protein [Candidatus Sumerlaeota bacterium]